jgi:hypothetical protein
MTKSSHIRRRAPRNPAQQRASEGAPSAADSETSAADESGNRALHAVAAGPNPNLGRGERDDIERPTRQRDDGGGIEST